MESQLDEFPLVSNVSFNIGIVHNEDTLKNAFSTKEMSNRDILLDKLNITSVSSHSTNNTEHKVKEGYKEFDPTLISFRNVHVQGWKLVSDVSSKIIDYDEDSVVLECLIDRENRIYEEQEFSISLFNGFEIEIGRLFKISIYNRANQMMIDVKDDPKLILANDFPIIDLYNKFKDLKLTNKD